MARHHILSGFGILLSIAFTALWFDLLTLPGVEHDTLRFYMEKAPVWAVVFVGVYCLLDIVTGVLGMGDAAEAKDELMKDVAAAKKDLNGKGIKVE